MNLQKYADFYKVKKCARLSVFKKKKIKIFINNFLSVYFFS
jgi:hypothetical protein